MGRELQLRARRRVGADPDALFEFLAELENHWRLGAQALKPVGVAGDDAAGRGGRWSATPCLFRREPGEVLNGFGAPGGRTQGEGEQPELRLLIPRQVDDVVDRVLDVGERLSRPDQVRDCVPILGKR
jgi:hypothetical protein